MTKGYLVSGRVQGVFFRASTKDTARSLGITGWVQNLADGDVEIRAQGTEEQLTGLERWLWQGPPAAKVRDVEVSDIDSDQKYQGFEIV